MERYMYDQAEGMVGNEIAKGNVHVTTLPPDLPGFIVGIPSGRLNVLPGFVGSIAQQLATEGHAADAMIMITDNGATPHATIAKDFAAIDRTLTETGVPVYLQTGETKQMAFQEIARRLPTEFQDDPEAMQIAENYLTKGGYGPQRVRMEAYLSTLGYKNQEGMQNGHLQEESNGHLKRVHLSLDDDLAFNGGKVPYLQPEYGQRHGIMFEENGAAFIPRDEVAPNVEWKAQRNFTPYIDTLGQSAAKVGIPIYEEGRNDQNPALEATEGGKKRTTFREHGADNSRMIEDPNARFLLGFGKKWGMPDFEAYSKLLTDVQAGGEGELNVLAVPTGDSRSIGVLTHPVNMDTAHTAKNWADPAANLLAFLITNPKISDTHKIMHSIDENGVSRTNGVRAEMCLLIGPDGLLKQITDAFGDYHVAAQVSSTFEHRRLGGAVRATEAVATFSEFMGMELAAVMRQNLKINPEDYSLSLNDITHNPEILDPHVVTQMYEKMQLVLGEIDNSVARMSAHKDPASQELVRSLQKTKFDIFHRLRNGDGFEAFKLAVNQELREQYKYMMKGLKVYGAILRAGADARREGQYPVAQYVPSM